jgi:hypothetical protein
MRIREIGLEIAIGLALVAGIVFWVIYVPERFWPERKWWGLTVNTVFTFGYSLRICRPYWRRDPFWRSFLGLLAIHLAALVTLLGIVGEWGLIWYMILSPIEIAIICPILAWIVNHSKAGGPGNPEW